jgi:hypothetical protein
MKISHPKSLSPGSWSLSSEFLLAPFTMNMKLRCLFAILIPLALSGVSCAADDDAKTTKLNNLVSELLDVVPSSASQSFSFNRPTDGWIFISLNSKGDGTVRATLDSDMISMNAPDAEAVRYVAKGRHELRFEPNSSIEVQHLQIRSIPELIHCGLGFNPEIKSYGVYDWDFLHRDILPNVTTLIVPANIEISQSAIDDWHRLGKKFLAEVGINSQAETADEHKRNWTDVYHKAPFLDGLIINEFIVNRPVVEWAELTPERLERMARERQQYSAYGEALKSIRQHPRYSSKMLYAYVGGSGKKLNQEIIGTNFVRIIKESGYRIALERYLHEMSTPKGSQDALKTFIDGIADWEAKEAGVKEKMILVLGLFSMPPGSINKQPNVDFHVWMDQQMNLIANHSSLSGIAGLEWWTSSLADEETVRFAGKLYRHYAIEGRTNMLTSDPLFLSHIRNADFEKGTETWTLHPAIPGSITAKSFARYGRIEGRYMGLGRPADPEHIGDTFLWMKRNVAAPNTFSQTIKRLEPGRLYSMKMLTCDYEDLVNPRAKKKEEANRFIGSITLDNVDLNSKRSFTEMYSSSPEPTIPVWITYHWKVFRARDTTATLTVSDWAGESQPAGPFSQEQTFNFIEVQPYHE